MFRDVYASSSAGQQLPQKRQRSHHHSRDSSPERPLQYAKPSAGGCDDNNVSGGDDDFPDEHSASGGVILSPEDLARMSPTSRRRYQSRMSSARHRERQHKRIISTTEEVERLERCIKTLEMSITSLHRQPLPHHNAAADWRSNRPSGGGDIGDAHLASSNPAAVSSPAHPRHHVAAGEIPGNRYHGDSAAQPSTRSYNYYGVFSETSSSLSRQDRDLALTGESPPTPRSDELAHKPTLALAKDDIAAPMSSDALAGVLARRGSSGQYAEFDFEQMLALIRSLKGELSRLQQCALHMRGMKHELARIVSTFTQCSHPRRRTSIPHLSLEAPHSKSEPLPLPPMPAASSDRSMYGGGFGGNAAAPRGAAPSQLVIIPQPPTQSAATSPSGPPDSASSALSRIAISSLVGAADVASVYHKDGVPLSSNSAAGKPPTQQPPPPPP
ncbi:hypothetical protein GGH91_000918 [Coemansia sp. RSA 2671]|nr:hypothetical protein LPJ60_002532 [Coemansia sp. RSA 2675]KAJ2349268.1 hypothetical protein GGH91_000918 [Coemansia sp. RSA 2671]